MIKEKLIKEVEDLIQFAIMLSIFFLSIIDVLFKYADSTPQQIGETQLKWSLSVAILIICFLTFKIFKDHFSNRVLTISKFLLFSEIFFFIPPIIILSTNLNKITSYIGFYSLEISLWSLVILPTLILGTLCGLPNLFNKIDFKKWKK